MSGRRGHASTWLGALIALCWLAASGPAWAQTATNTSGLEGKVTDESGAVLPGVTVTISSPALQAPQLDTITDESGRYRFSALPRGVYKVSFTLSGFQKVTREGLNIDTNLFETPPISRSAPRRERHRGRRLAGDRRPHDHRRVQYQERRARNAADLAQLRGHGQARARHSRLRRARRRRQPHRRRPRLAGQLRIDQRRVDADARRHQHRRHRRLLRHGRG